MNVPSEATDSARGLPADAGPRLYGVIDVLRADRIAGWAIDRTDATAALDIDIRRDGRVVASVRADRPRPDLVKTGVGTGRYGFAADLDPPLEPGFEFTVGAVARAPDGARLELRRSGGRDRDPERRLVERLYEEVRALRAARGAPADALAGLVERLEVVQARIEATLGRIEPPEAAAPGPNLVLWLALATAGVSVGLGVLSLLWS